MQNIEIWKDVPNYVGIYQVSNIGNVKSLDHYIKSKNGKCLKKGRILQKFKTKKGYLQTSLSKDTKRLNTGIHRVVALAFIPNPENKPQVNHINGIKTDNRVENLEWCTNKENQIHAVKNKLSKHNLAEKHHNSKLTNEDVIKVRQLHSIGFKNHELAKDYNISRTAMSNILRKKTYFNI